MHFRIATFATRGVSSRLPERVFRHPLRGRGRVDDRTLLLLARYGKHDKPVRAVPLVSQETLAEMVGTTRSRVNFFMKKFERLGFIDYKNGLKVNNSLLTVILHD